MISQPADRTSRSIERYTFLYINSEIMIRRNSGRKSCLCQNCGHQQQKKEAIHSHWFTEYNLRKSRNDLSVHINDWIIGTITNHHEGDNDVP